MKRPLTSLPTPEQIAATPELVALHTLEHVLELTFRTLVSIHPELVDPELPYWAIDPSPTRHLAHSLVRAASHLEREIEEYLAALERDRQTALERHEDDLPF